MKIFQTRIIIWACCWSRLTAGEGVIHLKEVLRLKPGDEQVKEQLHRLGVQK